MVERQLCKLNVWGSNPHASSKVERLFQNVARMGSYERKVSSKPEFTCVNEDFEGVFHKIEIHRSSFENGS